MEDVKRDFSDIVLPPALQARRAPFEDMLCSGLWERSLVLATACRISRHDLPQNQHLCQRFERCRGD